MSATSGMTVADDERVEDAVGVRPAAADPDQQRDQDRQPGQQDEQDRPAPAEQAAQGDVDERRHDASSAHQVAEDALERVVGRGDLEQRHRASRARSAAGPG